MNITRTSYRINTIRPDGSQLSIGADYTDPTSYSLASIAETKEFQSVYSLQIGQTFVGKTIFITAGMVSVGNAYPSGSPASGYKFIVTGGAANATIYNAPYIGCSNNGANNEMFKVTVTFTGLGQIIVAQTVTIKVQQILAFDIQSYNACNFFDNQTRLLKSAPADVTNLLASASANSFYNNSQKVWANVVHFSESTDFFRDEIQVPFQAAWYEKNPLNAAPYFSAPTIALEVNGVVATGLSPIKNTKVYLGNSCPVSPDNLFAILIDTTDNDATKTFWDNYDYSAAEIITIAGASALSGYNSKFMSPSRLMTLVSGSTYEAFFEIDYSQLTAGRKYRVVWILYNLDPYYSISDSINTFISDEYTADFYEPFDGTGIEFVGSLSDYQREYLGNYLQVVPEERIKAKIKMTLYDLYSTTYTWEQYLLARFGQAVSALDKDIRSTLKQIDLLFYWEETIAGQVYRHVVDEQTIVRTGINNYLLPLNTEFNSIGTDVAIPDFQDVVEVTYTFRVRYEANILNIRSYIDGVLQPAPLATMDWRNQTIFIEWSLYFDYPLLLEEDTVTFTQKILVTEYENDKLLADRSLDFVDEDSEDIVICTGDDSCFTTELIGLTSFYRHIVNIDRPSHKVQNIEEEEVWTGVLPILASDKLTSVEESYFYDDEAIFCVDQDEILLNTEYKVAAIAKKFICDNAIIIGILPDFVSYGGAQHVTLSILVTGTVIIYWGDGTSDTITGTGSFTHQYTSQGISEIIICGDVEFISTFYVEDVENNIVTYIQIENAGTSLASMDLVRIYGADLMEYLLMPNIDTLKGLDINGGNLINGLLKKLDLRKIILIDTQFRVSKCYSLDEVLFNPSVLISAPAFGMQNNATLNQVMNFGTNIIPIISGSNEITINNGFFITYSITVATLDAMINNIYVNRLAFDNSANKQANFLSNMPTPTGTVTAPTGYIQANGITVGNDGTPANAKQQIYVLQNQNIDNTTTKKYNWTFTTN